MYHLIGIGELCKKYDEEPSIEPSIEINAPWKAFPNSLKGLLSGNPVTEYTLGGTFEDSHRIPLKVLCYTSRTSSVYIDHRNNWNILNYSKCSIVPNLNVSKIISRFYVAKCPNTSILDTLQALLSKNRLWFFSRLLTGKSFTIFLDATLLALILHLSCF